MLTGLILLWRSLTFLMLAIDLASPLRLGLAISDT